jgi:hypothetical protein
MHGQERTGTGVVTESAVQATLRRGSQPALAPDEERTIRMRVGAGLPLSARLERIATATDTEIELLAYEIEAYLVMKEQRAAASRTQSADVPSSRAPARVATTTTSRTKEKIIRALRRKA